MRGLSKAFFLNMSFPFPNWCPHQDSNPGPPASGLSLFHLSYGGTLETQALGRRQESNALPLFTLTFGLLSGHKRTMYGNASQHSTNFVYTFLHLDTYNDRRTFLAYCSISKRYERICEVTSVQTNEA